MFCLNTPGAVPRCIRAGVGGPAGSVADSDWRPPAWHVWDGQWHGAGLRLRPGRARGIHARPLPRHVGPSRRQGAHRARGSDRGACGGPPGSEPCAAWATSVAVVAGVPSTIPQRAVTAQCPVTSSASPSVQPSAGCYSCRFTAHRHRASVSSLATVNLNAQSVARQPAQLSAGRSPSQCALLHLLGTTAPGLASAVGRSDSHSGSCASGTRRIPQEVLTAYAVGRDPKGPEGFRTVQRCAAPA
jgi:hypothetical protein